MASRANLSRHVSHMSARKATGSADLPRRLGGNRETHRELASSVDVLHVHAPIVGFDDATSDSEPEACSGHRLGLGSSRGLAAEADVEQPGNVRLRDTAALVAYPDDGGGAGVAIGGRTPDGDVDDATGRGMADCVGDQIGQRPIQLADIAGDGECLVAVTAQLNALLGGQWLQGGETVRDDIVEGDPFGCDGEDSGLDPRQLE